MSNICVEKKIFIIQSYIGAMIMAILAQDQIVKVCIVEIYIGYSDNRINIIKKLIEKVNIEKVFFVKLYYTKLKENSTIQYINLIAKNRKIISKFNKMNFEDKLFSKENTFIAEACSQILNLSYTKIENIDIIDHSPPDAVYRIRSNKLSDMKKVSYINKEKFIFCISNPCMTIKKIINIGLNYIFKPIFPNLNKLHFYKSGFTMSILADDTYKIIDYRKFFLEYQFSVNSKIMKKPKALMLVTMKEEFQDLKEFFGKVENIDFIEMTVKLIEKHISVDELVVLKFHPHLYKTISKEKINQYKRELMYSLKKKGYEVCFFSSLVKDNSAEQMPVEIFIKPLNIKKIVGIATSVFWTVSSWEDVEIISDCREIKFLGQRMADLKSVLGGKFKLYV